VRGAEVQHEVFEGEVEAGGEEGGGEDETADLDVEGGLGPSGKMLEEWGYWLLGMFLVRGGMGMQW